MIEFLTVWKRDNISMETKNRIFKDLQALKAKVNAEKASGKKVVFTNGCFDILHKGHVAYLDKSRSLGDVQIVAINTDDSPFFRTKGPERPYVSEMNRAFMLAGLRSVDYVTFFSEETPVDVVKALMPNVITKASDYTIDTIVGAKEVMENGGEAYAIPLVDGFSTTSLVEKIKKGA
jgi:rfaE bifunctional protein nucleotidyltransferase chain/domain